MGASTSPPKAAAPVPEQLKQLKALVINLERRPDRWARVSEMLTKETPWLQFEQFKASDGTKNPIPEEDVAVTWNTSCNAHFGDYFEWVYDAPGHELDGKMWKWAADTEYETDEYKFKEDAEDEFRYIVDAPGFAQAPVRTATLEMLKTKETFKLKLQFQQKIMDPGETMKMSGGERGCAHSHLRLWREAAQREQPTLALEDDVTLTFDRSGGLGKASGKVFTQRLALALKHAPSDFDVIYLGWSGWRGGHFMRWKADSKEASEHKSYIKYIRKAEYVWTTVAYVITPVGAKKLLAVAAGTVNQPVDNFMAWEAANGRLNSYVAVDQEDDDSTGSGGIVDQFDFQGDSDIKKSDGGHQGDDAAEFAVNPE